jgi:cell fate (sporulation/competence/biofilm development) regulator YlbF (YheA/YmcA/DUF963 family)
MRDRPMRKSIVGSCLMAWALQAGLADAAFVIKLKNGNEFVTGRHWQEGNQVMFDLYGGVLGLDKVLVLKIDQSDKLVSFAVDTQQIRDEKSQPAAGKDQSESEKTLVPSIDKTQVKRDPNDSILKAFEALKQKFSTVNGMLTSELNEFSRNVAALKRKIQTSAKSNDYLNEFAELHKIGDDLEDIVTKRNQ